MAPQQRRGRREGVCIRCQSSWHAESLLETYLQGHATDAPPRDLLIFSLSLRSSLSAMGQLISVEERNASFLRSPKQAFAQCGSRPRPFSFSRKFSVDNHSGGSVGLRALVDKLT